MIVKKPPVSYFVTYKLSFINSYHTVCCIFPVSPDVMLCQIARKHHHLSISHFYNSNLVTTAKIIGDEKFKIWFTAFVFQGSTSHYCQSLDLYNITVTDYIGTAPRQFTTKEVGLFNVTNQLPFTKYKVYITAKNNDNLTSNAAQEILSVETGWTI